MTAISELIKARAALERMREDVHGGDDGCGSHCCDYHDAMRAVTLAAEAIGVSVQELVWSARHLNRTEYGYEEVRP